MSKGIEIDDKKDNRLTINNSKGNYIKQYTDVYLKVDYLNID